MPVQLRPWDESLPFVVAPRRSRRNRRVILAWGITVLPLLLCCCSGAGGEADGYRDALANQVEQKEYD